MLRFRSAPSWHIRNNKPLLLRLQLLADLSSRDAQRPLRFEVENEYDSYYQDTNHPPYARKGKALLQEESDCKNSIYVCLYDLARKEEVKQACLLEKGGKEPVVTHFEVVESSPQGEFALSLTLCFNCTKRHKGACKRKKEDLWLVVRFKTNDKPIFETHRQLLFSDSRPPSPPPIDPAVCPIELFADVYRQCMSSDHNIDPTRTSLLKWLLEEERFAFVEYWCFLDGQVQFFYIAARTVLFEDKHASRLEKAIKLAKRALELVKKREGLLQVPLTSNERWYSGYLEAEVYLTLGKVLFRNGRDVEARDSYQRAIELFEGVGDELGILDTINSLVNALSELNPEESETMRNDLERKVLDVSSSANSNRRSSAPDGLKPPFSFDRTRESVHSKIQKRQPGRLDKDLYSILVTASM